MCQTCNVLLFQVKQFKTISKQNIKQYLKRNPVTELDVNFLLYKSPDAAEDACLVIELPYII